MGGVKNPFNTPLQLGHKVNFVMKVSGMKVENWNINIRIFFAGD